MMKARRTKIPESESMGICHILEDLVVTESFDDGCKFEFPGFRKSEGVI